MTEQLHDIATKKIQRNTKLYPSHGVFSDLLLMCIAQKRGADETKELSAI